jgi:hypothetical protein
VEKRNRIVMATSHHPCDITFQFKRVDILTEDAPSVSLTDTMWRAAVSVDILSQNAAHEAMQPEEALGRRTTESLFFVL